MRPIDADALKDNLIATLAVYRRNARYDKTLVPYKRVIEIISSAPTIEPKRGEWKRKIVDSGFNADWICSECGYRVKTDFVGYNFCPNCGADMREREGE